MALSGSAILSRSWSISQIMLYQSSTVWGDFCAAGGVYAGPDWFDRES